MGLRNWLGSVFTTSQKESETDGLKQTTRSEKFDTEQETSEDAPVNTSQEPIAEGYPTGKFTELTQFQRDLLVLLGGMDTPSGLDLKKELESYYEDEIHHGRLYPNLDTLTEMELVEKEALDNRTNAYVITDYGLSCLRARRRWEEAQCADLTTVSENSQKRKQADQSDRTTVSETTSSTDINKGCSDAQDHEGPGAANKENGPDANDESKEAPSKDELIQEIQRLEDEYGEEVINSTYVSDHGEYPVSSYTNVFGSWEAALEAADIDKRDILLNDLAVVWKTLGREPTTTDLNQHGTFSSGLHTSYFESWSDAKEQCVREYDLPVGKEQSNSIDTEYSNQSSTKTTDSDAPTRENLIDELQDLKFQLGNKVVNSRYVTEKGKYSLNDYIAEFGSWDDALEAAQIDRKKEFLEEVARVWKELGEQPTTSQMGEHSDIGGALYSSMDFDGWSDVVEICRSKYDVPEESNQSTDGQSGSTNTNNNTDSNSISRRDLLAELHRVENEVDQLIRKSDLIEHTLFTESQYLEEFGSWDNALSEANIELKDPLEDRSKDDNKNAATDDDEPTRSDLIQQLQDLHDQIGNKIANSRYINEETPYSLNEYINEFGNWDASLDTANINRETIFLEELVRVWQELGEEPSTAQMREYGDLGAGLYSQQFGSWSAAKENVQEEYDLQTNTTQPKNSNTTKNEPSGHKKEETSEGPTKAELLSELHRLDGQLERLIKATDLSEYSIFSQSQYQAEFGSWNKALSAAGIDKEKALLDELQRVWEKLGRQPKTTEMNEYGEYSAGMYNRYFGSWNEAIQTLKQTGRLSEQGAVPTRHSAEESDAGKQGEGIAIDQLSESIYDNLTTVNDVSDSSRLEQPILVKIQSVPISGEYEKSREIQVRGITGEKFSLVCWSVHDINVNWQEGHWYLLREALGKVWKSEEVEYRQLSSTRELTATDVGANLCEDTISEALESRKVTETDNQSPNSDSSDLVGSLMDDIDL